MAFPDDPLGVRVELQAGGVWTDVTSDAYTRDPITITRGQRDGAAVADPSRCSVTLNNKNGRYSPRNPMSPHYGTIGRNTPLRVSIPGVESYLDLTGAALSGAETPDHTSLDITADLDIRVEAEVDDWTGTYFLIGKWGALGGGQQSYRLQVEQRQLYLLWTADGATLHFENKPLPITLPRRTALRATLDVDNGAGQYTCEFFTAPSLSGPWTSLGTVTDGTPTSVFNSTTPVKLAGFNGFVGRVYRGEIRSGIGGTVVAAPDVRSLPPGTTAWTDTAGRPWALIGTAQVRNHVSRFVGEVSSWPPRWAPSGEDVWVPIEGAGVLRRLGQGRKALDSTLRRRLPSRAPLAYWPCEEDRGATQAYSPLANGSPLTVSRWDFGQDDTLDGAAALPVIAPGGTMRGPVPAPASATGAWSLCMPYRVDGAAPVAEQEVLSWTTTGTARRWRITMGATGSHVYAYDASGAEVVNHSIATGGDLFSGWWRLEFDASQSGGNIAYRIGWTKIGAGAYNIPGTVAGTVGTVSQIDTSFGPGLPDIRIGHLTVWSAPVIASAYDSADKGFADETVIRRLRRLSSEEAQTVKVGFAAQVEDSSARMGPQRPDTLVSLFQQCADSDIGVLVEDRQAPALVYRPRALRYNQTPRLILDYAAGDAAPPLEPVDDDEATRNDVTVNRIGGSSARAVLTTGPMSVQAPPAGVGLYDDSVDLSLASDDQPSQCAAWLLHLGTWDEARVPTVRIALHRAPHLIPDFLALELGDRIQIVNTPSWLPPGPIDLIVQGVSETLGIRTWTASLTCVPAGPWTVGVSDSSATRADTDGCVLGAAIGPSDTSLVLVTTTGAPWITTATHPSELPVDLQVGGEQIRATAIAAGAADAFGRTVASGWGSADAGGAWTTAGGTSADFSVGSGSGAHTLSTVNVSRRSTLPGLHADFDLAVTLSSSAVATGASIFGGLIARMLGVDDLYYARLEFTTTGAVAVSIREREAGVESTLASASLPYTYTAAAGFRLRFRGQGTTLMARAWPAGTVEPGVWQVTTVDTTLTTAGSIGCRSISSTGTTNVAPVIRYDDLLMATPQQATVVRAVNGIVKSHAAGAAVRLHKPTIVAL